MALGIAFEDRGQWAPAVPAVAAGLAALLRLLVPARLRLGPELALGVALGALALALPLHAPIASVGTGPIPVRLLAAPQPGVGGCRLLLWIHGDARGRGIISAPASTCDWLPGQLALARLSLTEMRPRTNPGGRDWARHWRRRGVRVSGRIERGLIEAVAGPPARPAALFERTRRRFARAIDPEESGSRAGAVLRAVVAGDRSRLSEPVRAVFRRSGTAHLLAVSGLHVGFVFLWARLGIGIALRALPFLWWLRRARRISVSGGILAACAYAGLTGFGVPALRAAAMASAGTLAVLGGRPGSAWNGLLLAGLAVLVVEPASLFEPALGLSFAAVAGILCWAPGRGFWASLLGASAAAGLATAPLAVFLGLPLPAGTLIANATAIPWFAGVVIPAGLITAVLGAALPASSDWTGPAVRGAAELGIRMIEASASRDLLQQLPGVDATGIAAASLFAFGLRAVWLRRRTVAALLAAGSLGALVAGLLSASPASPPEILFLDVGHGDAIAIRGREETWLVDAGSAGRGFDAGRFRVVPALRASGIRRLGAIVLTHVDRDHAGGIPAVLESLPVGELWLSRGALDAPASGPVRRAAARAGVPLRVVGEGTSAVVYPWRITVRSPPSGDDSRTPNRRSLVLRLDAPFGCVMLPGDVPAAVERRLAPRAAACAVLKLAHHGSASSSDPRWLDALRPEVAIASAGTRTRGMLPDCSVRARLRARQITLWETRRWGAISVRLGPQGPLIAAFRPDPIEAALDSLPDGEAAGGCGSR